MSSQVHEENLLEGPAYWGLENEEKERVPIGRGRYTQSNAHKTAQN